MKKIFLLLCMGIFLLSGMSVCAQEIGEVNNVMTEEIVETVIETESKETGELPEYTGNVGVVSGNTRGVSKPKNVYDWNNGDYEIRGEDPYGGELYTEYCFTDFSTAELVLNAATKYEQIDREDVQVIIYRKGTIFDTEIARFTVEAGKSKTYDLKYYKPDKEYYILFNSGGPFFITGTLKRIE